MLDSVPEEPEVHNYWLFSKPANSPNPFNIVCWNQIDQ